MQHKLITSKETFIALDTKHLCMLLYYFRIFLLFALNIHINHFTVKIAKFSNLIITMIQTKLITNEKAHLL